MFKAAIKKMGSALRGDDYEGDTFAVRGVNTGFMDEKAFAAAWRVAQASNAEHWPDGLPDVRWRAHVAVWAAGQGLALDGDFVECGVYGGLLSVTICEYFKFRDGGPRFWLFDTFHGLPLDQVPAEEMARATKTNRRYQMDVYDLAKRNFAAYPGARIIRGALPGTLAEAPELKRIAFLSMDLNYALAEHDTVVALWDRIMPGAVIVLDDYGFKGHAAQYEMWNHFAASKDRRILTLPTGQGIFIK